MECYYCCHRSVQDLLADGQAPYERRFNSPFVAGPIIQSRTEVKTFHPIINKNQGRMHQFGTQVLPGMFIGYVLNAGEAGLVNYV